MQSEKNKWNLKPSQMRIYSFFVDLSFINAVVMIFYTFYKEAGNLGTLAAFMIGPFLMASQMILEFMNGFKKYSFILNVMFILGGLISTIITLFMFNYKMNIFIVLNIILLIIMLIYLLVNNNSKIYK